MSKIAIPVILALAILMIATPISIAFAQNPQIQQGYISLGSTAGDTGDAVSQVIFLNGADELSFILTATGGNFNSTDLEVSVSTDGTTFINVDTLSLGTGSSIAETYGGESGGLTNSTTTEINPSAFPYVNLTTTDGVNSVVERITWTAR